MALMPFGSPPDKWNSNLYGTNYFLQPKVTTRGVVVGQNLDATTTSGFNIAAALFNDSPSAPNQGLNYFVNLAYGTSGIPVGGSFLGGHARGTAASPAQTLNADWLGGVVFAGHSGSAWITSGASHTYTGLWSTALANVTSTIEKKIYIGGVITPMISFRSDNNAILLNESQLDSDITFYSDTGTTLVLDGGTTQAFFAVGSATAPTIAFAGDPDTGLHWAAADQLSIDAGGVSRVQVSSTITTINPDKIASGDFTIHGDTLDNLIQTDASADAIGFFNATPVAQSTGWGVTNETTKKSFDADATTLDEIADVLGTLIKTLKNYGILGG